MLSFTSLYPKKGIRGKKGSRSRLVGFSSNDRVIFSTNHGSGTDVELISPDGSVFTIMSFGVYMDFIHCDVSETDEFIILTERVPKGESFTYRTSLFHVSSTAESKVIEDDSPCCCHFIPKSNSFLFISLNRVAQYEALYTKPKVESRHVRGGINIQNLKGFYAHNNDVYFIHSSYKQSWVTRYDLASNKEITVKSNDVPNAELPEELANLPSCLSQRPYFNFSPRRVFAATIRNRIVLIQQMFNSEVDHLQFSVEIGDFYAVYDVPKALPDIPILFYHMNDLVFVFSINIFCILFDFKRESPVEYNMSVIGDVSMFSEALPIDSLVMDYETGEIHKIEFDFSESLMLLDDTKCVSVLASNFTTKIATLLDIYTRAQQPQLFSELFENVIREKFYHSHAYDSVKPKRRRLFDSDEFDKQAVVIDKEFPSCGEFSRKSQFDSLTAFYMGFDMSYDTAAEMALSVLAEQNTFVLRMRAVLDSWVAASNPADEQKLNVFLPLHYNLMRYSAPSIPCLENEIEQIVDNICSRTMKERLFYLADLGRVDITDYITTEEELNFWEHKLPFGVPETARTNTMSSSSRYLISD